jgi:hypothetical protein
MRGLAAALILIAAAPPGPWRDAGQDPDIKYFTRERAESAYQEYRAEGLFAAPLAAVLQVVSNPGRYPGVNPTLKAERWLGDQGGRRVVYNRYDPPLGDDRDACIALSEEHSADGVVTLRWDNQGVVCIAPVDGVVRMPSNEGFWELTPADEGRKTRFAYQFFQDIGGWSGWAILVNPTTLGIVQDSVRAIGHAAATQPGSAGGK